MKPIGEMIDEKATRKEVQEHLKIFEYLNLQIKAENLVLQKRGEPNEISSGSSSFVGKDAMLCKISYVDTENEKLEDYYNWFFDQFNMLSEDDRNLLLDKYFYMLSMEEMIEKYNSYERKILQDLKNAEIKLAVVLKCLRIKHHGQKKTLYQ